MSAWDVVYTEHAERDLRDIYEYIAFSLLEPGTAKKQVRRILDAAARLDEMPLRFSIYEKGGAARGCWFCRSIAIWCFICRLKPGKRSS